LNISLSLSLGPEIKGLGLKKILEGLISDLKSSLSLGSQRLVYIPVSVCLSVCQGVYVCVCACARVCVYVCLVWGVEVESYSTSMS